MNDDTPPETEGPGSEPGFSALELDELLSAELDGELGAAAHDFGLDIDVVRSRIAASPGADDRRRVLAAARDRLAEPVEIDELLAARLRAKAVRAAATEHEARADDHHRRRRRILAATGAVAATIAVVAAIAAGMHGNGAQNENASAKSAPALTPVAAAPNVPSAAGTAPNQTGPNKTAIGRTAAVGLGSYADAHALGQAAVADVALHGSNVVPSTQSADGAASGPLSGSAQNATSAFAPAGVSTCATPAPESPADTLVLRASAVLADKPVIVFVFERAGEHVVVVENTNCKLVNLQMLS